jgi:hypothetical protein
MNKLFNWRFAGGVVFAYGACGSVYLLERFTKFGMSMSAILVLGIVLAIPCFLLFSKKFYVKNKKLAATGISLAVLAILLAGFLFMLKHSFCAENFVYYCS